MNDNVLASRKFSKKWILVILLIVIAIGSVIIAVIFLNNSSTMNDNGATETAVLELTDDSFGRIASIQSRFVKAVTGDLQMPDFFSEWNKSSLNEMVNYLKEFYDSLNQYDVALLSSEYVRDNFIELRNALRDDLVLYDKLIMVYNAFYDYVNSDYDSSFEDAIIDLGDQKIVETLDDLEAAVSEYGNYISTDVIQNIFSVALGEDYPKVYYYVPIGNIIGGIKDAE